MNADAAHEELDRAAESTTARILGRVITPVLLVVIGALLSMQLNDIKVGQERNRAQLMEQAVSFSAIATNMQSVSRQVDKIEDRVRRLEVRGYPERDASR